MSNSGAHQKFANQESANEKSPKPGAYSEMKLGFVVLLGIALAAYLAVPGLAQERPNGFYLTSPLGLSSGYDDNFVVGSRVLDSNVTLLTSPTFAWIKNTHRTMFSADYQGEFEMVSHDQGLDAWDHAA